MEMENSVLKVIAVTFAGLLVAGSASAEQLNIRGNGMTGATKITTPPAKSAVPASAPAAKAVVGKSGVATSGSLVASGGGNKPTDPKLISQDGGGLKKR
jgi:hypothetical protein